MTQRFITTIETTRRNVPISDEDALEFTIEFLLDEFMLRDIRIENGRRILTEEVYGGSHSWFDERDMGPEYPFDRAALLMVHELQARAKSRRDAQ